ncbi:unnamed protein product [Enterobius vermicularis]|uniref:Vesicle-fusing ATPase n=1 Tax=Enterobius vermicularis TaxID=51028 RepID=A0A0N4V408_ENTVE|nr:unnamed protein product [Enterobius vermicularis]
MRLKVRKCPTDELAVTNCAVVNPVAFDAERTKYVLVKTEVGQHFVFNVKNHKDVKTDEIAFAVPQRKWATLSLDQEVEVERHTFGQNSDCISVITLATDFNSKRSQATTPLNADHMAREFLAQFPGHAFTRGELLVFRYEDEKNKSYILSLTINVGRLLPNSAIIFDKAEGSSINLIGKSKGSSSYQSIINPDWDFQKMGIGGLDKEFTGIFRRAFASRVFPPEVIEQLGIKHVRGMLLYGPPGTGKTLMARQIGKMLNAREPKIVNGPEILDKYVGESESNIRKLFADAEEEARKLGPNSGLHIIIFDEIDAICKKRGSVAGSTAVHDTVVNQILSKMDGVGQLNNILVIGMTNRVDMIDEALLRPGRLEVQLEISLPDENGRLQILKIHTSTMKEYNKLDPDVNLELLAKKTKNFSGAEIEGLVRAAQSTAMNRLIKVDGKVKVDPDAFEKLMVSSADFEYALENDVKPAFGREDEKLEEYLRKGFVEWSPRVTEILNDGVLLAEKVRDPGSEGFVTALLAGAPSTGKTCLAASIAKRSDFPFIKMCSPVEMVGFTETAKCMMLRSCFEDAYKSPLSVIIVDDIERLLDFSPIGPRYSNIVLQALLVLLRHKPPKKHRLLVLGTSSGRSFLRDVGLTSVFDIVYDVPALTTVEEIMAVIDKSGDFSLKECGRISEGFLIGIKKLLKIIELDTGQGYTARVDGLLQRIEALGYDL